MTIGDFDFVVCLAHGFFMLFAPMRNLEERVTSKLRTVLAQAK